MAELVTIQAKNRTVTGKKVKRLRREGWVPGVIYGQDEPVSVQVEALALRRALRAAGTNDLIEVAVGDVTKTVLAREIQRHLTRGDLVHIDFYEVNLQETISIDIALTLTGQIPSEVLTLGSVSLVLQTVTVECLPADLPSEIEVDLTLIQSTEDSISVADLVAPEGVAILTDPDTSVTTFSYARTEEEEEDEDEDLMFAPAADAVEVIGKGKEEEEEEL